MSATNKGEFDGESPVGFTIEFVKDEDKNCYYLLYYNDLKNKGYDYWYKDLGTALRHIENDEKCWNVDWSSEYEEEFAGIKSGSRYIGI